MKLRQILNKPEYWFRPSQIVTRFLFSARNRSRNKLVPVRLPWADILYVRPTETIGKSLLTLGVHELAVSELLWRLVDPEDTCVDVGANIGYMTSLLASRTGPTGRVLSFEPHPTIFEMLQANVEHVNNRQQITVFKAAIGAVDAEAVLIEPPEFEENQGSALLSSSTSGDNLDDVKHQVSVRKLDSIFSSAQRIGILKVDVEGAELDVFRGATRLLSEGRIRDIIWEDENVFPSESVDLLVSYGYTIYQFSKRILGVAVCDPFATTRGSKPLPWETTNFFATSEPARASARLSQRGWRCLR